MTTTVATPQGRLSKELDGTYTLTFDRVLAHPIDRVWAALTEPAQVGRWLGELKEPIHVGGPFRVDMAHSNRVTDGVVDELTPPHVLSYSWNEPYNPHLPISHVRWQLEAVSPTETRLKMTHTRLREGMAGFGGGWHAFIDLLEGTLADPALAFHLEPTAMKERQPFYKEQMEVLG